MKNKTKSIIFIIIFMLLIGVANTCFYNQDQFISRASTTGTITASSLNVRKGAGTNHAILTNNGVNVSLKKGATVTILKEVNKWYLVSFTFNKSTVKGYVLGDFVTVRAAKATSVNPTPTPTPTQQTATYNIPGKVIANNLKVRVSASTKANQLVVNKKPVSIVKNQAVTILGERNVSGEKWYHISFKQNGVTRRGHVLAYYIQMNLKASVKARITSNTVKVQTAAGTGKAILKTSGKEVVLPKGKAIVIVGEVTANNRKWFQITFANGTSRLKGFVLANSTGFRADAPAPVTKTGTVSASSLNVRVDAGTDKAQLVYNNVPIKLTRNQKVTILSTKVVNNVTWYEVSFSYQNVTLKGYVSGDFILVEGETPTTPTPTVTPTPSVPPSTSPSPTPTTPVDNQQPLSEAEFEQEMTNQGFPESYKPYLRSLHQQFPNWKFVAYHTGLDWNTVIVNQNIVGKNLITNSKTIAWKSLEPKAYNWETDKFMPYDGTTWVTASKQALEYYMDPRNFLLPRSVFQFELLEYRSDYQNQIGVERILMSTPMSNAKYSFMDELTGTNSEFLYSETFMRAAEYSGVSPFHLATRVKQEVVTGPTTFSTSVTGTVPGYEGYYNFYNIGATHSTTPGGAVLNGLKYAMNGSTSATNNQLFLIPWNNQYRSIVGGAKFIGNNYINRGQNTGYLQKFNVTSYSRYNHQYMANVEAANAEASKTYNAYVSMLDVPIVFSIPVYLNMPATPCPVPSGGSNPNNWLKTLNVTGYSLTPSFKISDAGNVEYTVIVDNNITSINLTASSVSTTATVTGTGMIPLNVGANKATVRVTAQNGDVKTYTVNIIRN